MITPVDFRQKTFRTGIGYDKKDVDSFMVELLRNYEELYRSNAQQIAEIKDLNDELVRYKAMEESMQREYMVAEKSAEEVMKEAEDKAKKMEVDAKKKAKDFLVTAQDDLAFTQEQTIKMAQMYASLKVQINMLFKNYVDIINGEEFSIDLDALEAFGVVPEEIKNAINASDVVPEMNFAASAFTQPMPAAGAAPKQQAANATPFGSFEGDPQMRDESPLGEMASAGGGTVSGERGNVSSAGFGFSSLVESEEYKDPFAGIDTQAGNQSTASSTDTAKASSPSQTEAIKRTKSMNQTAAQEAAAEEVPEYASPFDNYESAEDDEEEIPTVAFGGYSTNADSDSLHMDQDPILSVHEGDETLSGDIENRPQNDNLIGDGDDTDEGFSFV